MTLEEMLRAEGATEEDLKTLVTPATRKLFEKQMAAAAEAKRRSDEIIRQNEEWRQTVESQNQTYLRERDTALANAAAETARLKKLQDLGLLQVAENLEPGSTQPKPGETPAFDPKTLERYVDRDTFLGAVDQEGDAIALVQDIASEHQLLFGNDPSKRLNFRDIRKEAKERKVPFVRVWEEKFNIPAARQVLAAKEKSEYESRIAAEAVTKYKSEHPETNPMLATPQISRTPFTNRPITGVDPKAQPWNRTDGEKAGRVGKVIQNLEKAGLVQ
jgi:hypothetical protein